MRFGILGSGSWGTALAKILTDSGVHVYWCHRSQESITYFEERKHNPHYLQSASFDMRFVHLSTSAQDVIEAADIVIIAIPSAFVQPTLSVLPANVFNGKKIISAVKGILPEHNVLLNDYLEKYFNVTLSQYFTVLGPCHAEEVAAEKLSYLTFSGIDTEATKMIAKFFNTNYLNTIINDDILGVQYAAVLKNIYAVGAGMAHGLDYGDNFQSVLIANAADEMAGFLRKAGILSAQVGNKNNDVSQQENQPGKNRQNYASSVYLGDLLVTCYSPHSRNRAFGNMIGKGYNVKTAILEMSMVAEGYNASKCMFLINEIVKAQMPIASTIYEILWENRDAAKGFKWIEGQLV